MNKLYQKRFDELEEQLKEIEATRKNVYTYTSDGKKSGKWKIDRELFTNWLVKVKDAFTKSCGANSEYYSALMSHTKTSMLSSADRLPSIAAVFRAAKADYEKGYFSSNRSIVQAEVFDSELEQATELLNNNYLSAAAVIAGTVLETTLRGLCNNQTPKIPLTERTKLSKMNEDLAKAGAYNKLKQKQITALADIRNSAAHGKPEEFSKKDVENMIQDVEKFLADYLPD